MTDHRSRRRRARGLVAFGLLVALGACVRGSLPPREFYRLALPDSLTPGRPDLSTVGAPLQGSLAVASYRTPGFYGNPGIVYRVNATEYGAYPSREWAIPLGDQLGSLTTAVLRRMPLATGGAIYEPPAPRSETFAWHGSVREFEEVDRGRDVYAAVRLEAVVVRTADDSVVWQGTVRLERPVRDPTMPNIVAELSSLAVEGIAQLVGQARITLAPGAAQLAAPRP